jgi:Uma2 family endonuclease
MAMLICDPGMEERLLAERQANGHDRWDEVWDGVYVMAPLANDEHQELQAGLTAILQAVLGWNGLALVRAGVNVSDREKGWEHNYRCPDVVVFTNDTKAKNCDTHWFGGPDFTIEIVSPRDRSREKFDFYAKVGVRELLLIDRAPWSLELHRLVNSTLVPAGKSVLPSSDLIVSQVVPLSFKLIAGSERPSIEVTHRDGRQRWVV